MRNLRPIKLFNIIVNDIFYLFDNAKCALRVSNYAKQRKLKFVYKEISNHIFQ